MDWEEVEEYVERSQQLLETSPQMNEETTKMRLIQPFLRLLGWDLYSTEVQPEYTVQMATGSTHVDYALLIGDSPVVFVEAKPVRSSLTDRNVQQLKSYMRQELDLDWGILTNGRTFEVLTKNKRNGGGEEVSVVRFDLEDLLDDPRVLELLSKEAIRSGKADEIASQVAQTNETIDRLSTNEGEIAQVIVDAVESEVGEFPLDLEEQSRDFVQNLVSALQEQRRFVSESGTTSTGDQSSSIDSSVPQTSGSGPIPLISRSDIDGNPEATVAVYPTQKSGLRFLEENEAWGFVRVGREFDYVAMYVSDDVSEVRYFAEFDQLVDPEDADLQRSPLDYVDRAKLKPGKKVVKFKRESLHELEDPIPFQTKYPQSVRYTSLGAFLGADTTDDLF